MNNWLHKKLTSILLLLAFSVLGFGAFAGTANAGISQDIANDLSLPSLATPTNRIGGIAELPDSLTQEQKRWILSLIETDPGVTVALDGQPPTGVVGVRNAFLAVDAAQADYDSTIAFLRGGICAVEASTQCQSDPSVSAKRTALNEAGAALTDAVGILRSSLITARNAQESLINSYGPVNQVSNITNTTATQIGTGGEAASTAISGLDAPPVDPNDPSAPTQRDPNAGAAAARDLAAAEWGAKDLVAVQMHAACHINPLSTNDIQLMPCVAELFYYVLYKPAQFALMGAGKIFDFILMLSIDNSQNMVVPGFIKDAWATVRDFSNMLFIFVLLYTGIMTMFGAADWRKTVLQVVTIALLINFSLFFAQVVIDAGNILAMEVKSAISDNTTSISEGLANSFKPQMFLNAAANADIGNDVAVNAIIVFIVAAVVSLFAAYAFFKAALLFLGRLIGFWFLMIVSPFAFISTTLPKGNKFQEWLENLLGLSFVAPVFLFSVYLIMMVIQSGDGILAHFGQQGTGWFNSLLGPVIVATLLCLALLKALSLAEGMAGDFGKLGSEMVGKTMGFTAGVATGGAATMGRKFVGGYAADKLAGGTLKEGTWQHNLALQTTKASFDVRNIPLPKIASKGLGNLGVDIGKGAGVGGFEKMAIEKEKGLIENVPELSIFEKQGIRERAEAEAKKNKAALAAAEADMEAALRAVEEAGTERIVKETKASAEAAKAIAEAASKKTETAQKAFDSMRNSGVRDPQITQALATAEREQEQALSALKEKENDFAKAVEKHSTSAATVALKKATGAVEEARKKGTNAEALTKEAIGAENKTRRENYTEKVEKENRMAADKIREKAAKKKPVDEMKELLKKMAKEEEEATKGNEVKAKVEETEKK